MIVYFYRWRLRPGREADFKAAWATVTAGLRQAGSEGSALFHASDGTWCGIARWPNREAREAAPDLPELKSASAAMADAIEQHVETLELSEALNLWAAYTPPA
jgi:quinol monooxygenase YgiN